MTTTHEISADCKACGSCVELCPNRILQKDAAGKIFFRADRLWMCFRCGHCMAVCPSQAVMIPGLSYEQDFYPQPALDDRAFDSFETLAASRRAGRSFQDKPVPRGLLEKLVEVIALAPPSFPPVKTELTVVADPALMQRSLGLMIDLYDHLVKMMANPVARFFIRRQAGRETFITLNNHVIPLLKERLPDLKSGKEDTLIRHAPAMILFHADRQNENYRTDIAIAMTYAILAAPTLGLAASIIDLIPPAVEKSPALRALLQIPAGSEVVGAVILGFPKRRFLRGIRRPLKSVTWL